VRAPTGISGAAHPAQLSAAAASDGSPGPALLNLGAEQNGGLTPVLSAEPILPQHPGARPRAFSPGPPVMGYNKPFIWARR